MSYMKNVNVNMPAVNIYLPDELFKKLKAEENYSGLVSKLLNSYYKITEKEEQDLNTLNHIDNNTMDIQGIKDEKKDGKKVEISNPLTEIKFITPEMKAEKIQSKKKNMKIYLTEFLGREATDSEVEEYFKLFEAGETNLWKFVSDRAKP